MAGETMQGVRVLPDFVWGNDPRKGLKLAPGEYVKVIGGPMPWMANDPNDGGTFSMGTPARQVDGMTRGGHTIEEHDDGTITVHPSLYDTSPGGWHGWLERGVWRSV